MDLLLLMCHFFSPPFANFWHGDKVVIVWYDGSTSIFRGFHVAKAYLSREQFGPLRFIGSNKLGKPTGVTATKKHHKAISLLHKTHELNVIVPFRSGSDLKIEEIYGWNGLKFGVINNKEVQRLLRPNCLGRS